MGSKQSKKKTRYFAYSTMYISDLEQLIKRGETHKVFQVVTYDAKVAKRLIWFLLENDINYEKKPAGAGITVFYVDLTVGYFAKGKD